MNQKLPSGTVTFLFTDIEGSTQLLRGLGEDYAQLLKELMELMRTGFQKWGGKEIDTQGDAFFVSFSRASEAIHAAVELQRIIADHPWPGAARVLVRMGLHTGEPALTESGYVGMDVHRAARISAAGHGGQILISNATRSIVEQDLPEGVSLRDLGEHRLKDLQHPERLYQIVIADLPSNFPPLKTLDNHLNNLPVQLTSFIGRDREIGRVKRLLGKSRLVTLTGSGGAGKTRLALQVGAEQADDFRDGVWLVELSSLRDGEQIPKTIASVLKIREDSHQALIDTLIEAVGSKSLLLILDNCEHLIDASAHAADELLSRCQSLKILATSREALNIQGEVIMSVPPLSLPGEWQASQPESLAQYDAVRLFIDRATAWLPDFTVTDRNASALARICTHLDGIPLAIELAAARVRSMSLEQIESRLNDRFLLLRSSSRTVSSRQLTLEAAIAWSYDLLPEKERILFQRLSVFLGGWTLDMAEEICADEVLEHREILELLTRLVDKSLVFYTGEEKKSRYHFLESIRQYAQDKLASSGEAERIHDKLFVNYYHWIRDNGSKIRTIVEFDILDNIELEHDNLRSALSWGFERDYIEEAAELVVAMIWFWYHHNYLREGTLWAEKAVAATKGASDNAQACAQYALGLISWSTNRYSVAQSALLESCEFFRACQDKVGIADALHILGHVVLDRGKHEEAKDYFNRSAALYRELNDRSMLLTLVGDLGLIAYLHGHFDQANQLFQEHCRLAMSLGSKDNMAMALNHLGDLARCTGDVDQAETFYRESLAIVEEIGIVSMVGSLRHNLAHVAKIKANFTTAMDLFRECVALFQANDDKKGIVECLEGIAETCVGMAKFCQAARLFGACQSLRTAFQVQWWPANQIAYEKSLEELKEKFPSDLLNEEWNKGYILSLEEAVNLAMKLE